MELLLNLVWISLAVLALFGFSQGCLGSRPRAAIPYGKALLAIACGAVLLFPVVSASDDLHPSQAVLEDASKKVQLGAAPLQLLRTGPPLFVLALSFTLLLSALMLLQMLPPLCSKACVLDGTRISFSGRAPPFAVKSPRKRFAF